MERSTAERMEREVTYFFTTTPEENIEKQSGETYMPIYEYDCHECGKPFEALILGFSTASVKCPECESENIKKKISTFALKGTSTGSSSFSSGEAACSTGST